MKPKFCKPAHVAAGSLLLGVLLASGSAFAIGDHNEGCTPGYWKVPQHWDSWPADHAPTDGVRKFFGPEAPGGTTAITALNFGGGPGVEGAIKILLRHAVAARLNAASDGVEYPISVGTVRNLTSDALATQDRGVMLELAAYFDELNNLGCPLD